MIVTHLRIKHHEDRAPLGVELLRVLHLLVGGALRVQFRLAVEQFLSQPRQKHVENSLEA